MRTSGGELAFVATFILDSLQLRERVVWYSSLLGKKASLKALVRLLKAEGISNIRSTSFVQGHTRRWGLAW